MLNIKVYPYSTLIEIRESVTPHEISGSTFGRVRAPSAPRSKASPLYKHADHNFRCKPKKLAGHVEVNPALKPAETKPRKSATCSGRNMRQGTCKQCSCCGRPRGAVGLCKDAGWRDILSLWRDISLHMMSC